MRPLVLAILAATLLLPPATAQDPGPTAPPPSPTPESASAPIPTGRLTGHVLCDDTRRPARGALVTIVRAEDGNGAFSGFANMSLTHVRSDGTYLVEHLPPGKYSVFANLAGYLSQMDDALNADPHLGATPKMQQLLNQMGTVVVTPGATASLDVTLQRGAAVSGQVLFADGSPAASVNLILEDAKTTPDTQHASAEDQMERTIAGMMFKRQNTSTDDQGRFRIAGVRAGSYRLAATQPQWNTDSGNEQRGEQIGMVMFGVADPRALRVYAGNTLHRLNAKVFDLRPGDEVTGIDISLPIDAFHDLRGTLAAADGRAINMGQVTLQDTTDNQFVFHASLSRDGSFLVQQVPAGTYTLTATNPAIGEPAPGPAGMPAEARPLRPIAMFAGGSLSVLVKDSDVDGLNLTLTEVPMPKSDAADEDQP